MYFSFHRRFGCLVRQRRNFDHRVKPVDGFPARAGRDVCAVGVHGAADGRMPQLALHILDGMLQFLWRVVIGWNGDIGRRWRFWSEWTELTLDRIRYR